MQKPIMNLRPVWQMRVEYEDPAMKPVQINGTLEDMKKILPPFIYEIIARLSVPDVVVLTVSAYRGGATGYYGIFTLTKKGLC